MEQVVADRISLVAQNGQPSSQRNDNCVCGHFRYQHPTDGRNGVCIECRCNDFRRQAAHLPQQPSHPKMGWRRRRKLTMSYTTSSELF